MKYRKRPVIIEAVEYDGGSESLIEVVEFIGADFIDLGSDGSILIRTLEGEHIASVGDFIIRGIAGEHYPCKPRIFEATYDLVGESDASV